MPYRGSKVLNGIRVLIVEDEYYIAAEWEDELRSHGAEIVGPAGDLASAMKAATLEQVNVAIVDLNLRDKFSFGVADELLRRDIPFGFATGYEREMLPFRFRRSKIWTKPFELERLVNDIATLCGRSPDIN